MAEVRDTLTRGNETLMALAHDTPIAMQQVYSAAKAYLRKGKFLAAPVYKASMRKANRDTRSLGGTCITDDSGAEDTEGTEDTESTEHLIPASYPQLSIKRRCMSLSVCNQGPTEET